MVKGYKHVVELKKGQSKSRGKSRSQLKGKKICWHCHKECHIRRFCPKRHKGQGHNSEKLNLSYGYDSA